jgi:hypothetical protein
MVTGFFYNIIFLEAFHSVNMSREGAVEIKIYSLLDWRLSVESASQIDLIHCFMFEKIKRVKK